MAKESMHGVHGVRSDAAIVASVLGGMNRNSIIGRGGGGHHHHGGRGRGGRGFGRGDIAFYEQPWDYELPIIMPTMPATVIDPAIEIKRMLLPTINACHQRALKRSPGLSGKLSVQFVVAPDGSVSSFAVTDDTLGSPEVSHCVSQMIQRHRFTPSGAPTNVSFMFSFQAGT